MSGIPGDTLIGDPGSGEDSAAVSSPDELQRRRRRELWALCGALLLSIALYFPTYLSMVQIWLRSDTFLHGILIFPISAYLVWRRWPVLRTIDLQPFYPGLAVLLLVAAGWLLADLLNVQVVKQFAAVALLPLLVLTVAGTEFSRAIAFPLGYLVFAVPFGEALIPYLIDFTAFFTVEALEITGMPVYREGQFFSIPAGDFEVAKACSGIRYLLASLALGTLYGYLIYDSFEKRLAFFAFALLLPIAANGLRAYLIVLLAHFSGMRIAVGVDHIIFGWLFFGLVMVLMFWIGDMFRDRPLTDAALERVRGNGPGGAATSLQRFAPVMLLALLVTGAGPVLSLAVPATGGPAPAAGVPATTARWQVVDAQPDWYPDFPSATYSVQSRYAGQDDFVDLAMLRYDVQWQDAELANSGNSVADPGIWRFGQASDRALQLGGQSIPLRETIIYRDGQTRLVWSFLEVNGVAVSSDLETKWKEALSLLRFELPTSAAILVSVPFSGDELRARRILEAFVAESWVAIHRCLYRPGGAESACRSSADLRRADHVENLAGENR